MLRWTFGILARLSIAVATTLAIALFELGSEPNWLRPPLTFWPWWR
jgi:hypothetical protein